MSKILTWECLQVKKYMILYLYKLNLTWIVKERRKQLTELQTMTLKALRARVNLSRREVAEKLGIHQQSLYNWEKNSEKLPLEIAKKLSELYQYPIKYIYVGTQDEYINDLNNVVTEEGD